MKSFYLIFCVFIYIYAFLLAYRKEQESLKMKKIYAILGVLKNVIDALSQGSLSPEVRKPQIEYTGYS